MAEKADNQAKIACKNIFFKNFITGRNALKNTENQRRLKTRKEDEMVYDKNLQKKKWQGPKIKPILQPIIISDKEVKIKIIFLNSWQKRWVHLELEDVTPLDGIFEMEREKEYIAKVPKGVSALNIKVTDMQSGIWSTIRVTTPSNLKPPIEKPKDPIEIIGPCGGEKIFYVTVRTKEPRQPISFSSDKRLCVVDMSDVGPEKGTHFELTTIENAQLIIAIAFKETKATLFFRIDGQTYKRMLIK